MGGRRRSDVERRRPGLRRKGFNGSPALTEAAEKGACQSSGGPAIVEFKGSIEPRAETGAKAAATKSQFRLSASLSECCTNMRASVFAVVSSSAGDDPLFIGFKRGASTLATARGGDGAESGRGLEAVSLGLAASPRSAYGRSAAHDRVLPVFITPDVRHPAPLRALSRRRHAASTRARADNGGRA
jgi:hypothetical protein